MTHSLKFIFQEDVSHIFDSFTSLLGIRIAFFSQQGQELRVGKNKPICRYCQLLRTKLDFEQTCLTLDTKQRKQAAKERQLVAYTCHGGMMEAVMPVIVDGEIIGYVMIGQFRKNETPPKRILSQCKQKKIQKELRTAYRETPCFEAARIEEILFLFSSLVQLIVIQRLVQVHSDNPVHALLTYMEEHPEADLDLKQAARLVCRSVSSLTHHFKQTTGKSFKQFQIDKKLDQADHYFRTRPDLSIGEIAYKLGYVDPLYFSKLYKRHRGCAPTVTIQRFHSRNPKERAPGRSLPPQ